MKRTAPSKYQDLTKIQALLVRIYVAQRKGETRKAQLLDKKLARLQRIEMEQRRKSHIHIWNLT